MDQWIIRKVHESGVIGGNTKLLYEIGPTKEIDGNKPYKNMGGSPWGTSNVMAKVMGLSKQITLFIRKTLSWILCSSGNAYRERQGIGNGEYYCIGSRIHLFG